MVLERGVLSFFKNRGDATTGTQRKSFKYLDGATIKVSCGYYNIISLGYLTIDLCGLAKIMYY